MAREVGQRLDARGPEVLIAGSGVAEVRIADGHDRRLPTGKVGEIPVRGPFVWRGGRNRLQWMGVRVSSTRWRTSRWVGVLPR